MARKLRIEKAGFYHIINRGVARGSVYHDDEDFIKFLDIVQEASEEYSFEVFSFCLMSNHYHLLLKTTDSNLSRLMQKINSRYSVYYNNKYKRVGPLWQGRFKSWFVFDDNYLHSLIKYIEFNPIKANITKKIGEYKWAMSSDNFKFSMLNYELIGIVDFDKNITDHEQKEIDSIFNAKFELDDEQYKLKFLQPLESYFNQTNTREYSIPKAIKDGRKGVEIAHHLGVSKATVSKIYKKYKQKVKLFEYLRDKGLFWSYSRDISYEEFGAKLLIEYILKYADFDNIKSCVELFGKKRVKSVWEEKLKSDKAFIKTNLMIARVFFGMDVESDYFKGARNERVEKLRLLAS